MAGELAVNPLNTCEGRVFFDTNEAIKAGETRHPVDVIEEIGKRKGFIVLDGEAQTLFGGWNFWILFDNPLKMRKWPGFFRENISWMPREGVTREIV